MAGSSVEVEVKLPFADARVALQALLDSGFVIEEPRGLEVNILFDTPARDLRARGLGVRHRTWHGEHIITYKGPVQMSPDSNSRLKQREELETKVGDPAPILATWAAAGLVPSFRYEKYRTVLHHVGGGGHAMLDETPLGVFVELEGVPEWIDRTALALGFSPQQYIQLSYPALQAESCRKQRIAFRDLLFSEPEKFS